MTETIDRQPEFTTLEPQYADAWLPIGSVAASEFESALASPALVDPAIPQSINDLDSLVSTIYDLPATKAGELKIPIAGSVGGGASRRVVVSEYAQSRALVGSDGIERRYGYAIRLCMTVNKLDGNAKLTLPFLSAQAELGMVEAGWSISVIGLAGPKINAAVLPPKPLSVETFVIAQQSLEKLIAAVNDPETRFQIGTVISKLDPDSGDTLLHKAAVQSFATYRLFKGDSANRTIGELGSLNPADADTISDTFVKMGVVGANEAPSQAARSRAQAILGAIKVSN